MDKCIMCGAEVFKYIGYVTDGKIFVCDRCAESHSLTRIMTRVENSGCDSNLKSCYAAPIEAGLVNQTDSPNTEEKPHVELDKSILDEANSIEGADNELFHDIENMSEEDFLAKYSSNPCALNAWWEAHVNASTDTAHSGESGE